MSSKDVKNSKTMSAHQQTGKKSKASEGKSSILQAFKGNSKENSPSSTIKQQEIRHHNPPPPPPGPAEVMSGGALDDEPHPQLLAKLGLLYAEQRVSHVKTISHPHPLLNKGGAIHGTVSRTPSSQQQHHHHDNDKNTSNSGGRKKPGYTGATTITTSPASTLSDKGIGSSVGSFDVEFRNNQSHQQSHFMQHQGPQISRHHPLMSSNYETVNVPKTGSLDSRTQEYAQAMHHQEMGGFPVVNHTRSSSDIICNRSAAVSSHLQRPNLAEQAQVPLWNHDPRRGTTTASQQPDMTSLMRSRRPGSRRPQFAVGGKMDGMETIDRGGGGGAESFCGADVKKLPQLCVDSSSPATLSGSSLIPNSSTSSIASQQHDAATLATTAHNSGNNYHQHQQQQYYPTPDAQLMPPPPPAVQHQQHHHQHHLAHQQQQQPPAGRMLAARGRVSSDSSLGTLNGIQPGYHNGGGGEGDSYYSKQWNHQGAAPPPYDRHLSQNNQHLLSNPAISVSGTGSSTSSDATYSAAPPPNMVQMSGTALWEQNARPHSMSVPFAPSLMASHAEAAYHIPEARSASPSINGDETLSRRGGIGRSSTRSNPGERRMMNPETGVQRYGHHQQRVLEPVMQSLTFEIPLAVTSEVKFIGREWLYGEISQCFTRSESTTSNCKGVVVIGKAGHGKTSFVRHLVSYSYHGNRNPMQNGNNFRLDYDHLRPGANSTLQGHHNHHAILPRMNRQPPASLPPHMLPPSRSGSAQSSRTGSPIMNGSSASSRTGSQASLGEDSNCKKLASQVVAYHFCQSSVNKTCYVPEFVSNIATQLTRAPQLTAYRELLLSDARLFQYVTIRNCIINPTQALTKGIIEPLQYLRKEQKLPKSTFIIIIDAIDESLLHKPDYGYSIFSFIEEHIHVLPDFMKIIVTARTREEARVRRLPLETFTLDLSIAAVDSLGPRVTTPTTPTSPPVIAVTQKKPQQMTPEDEMIKHDLFAYVQYRINNAPDVLNMARTVKGDGAEKQLISHLTRMSEGNFLYLRMTLDLMEKGHIVPKSINFKVVPQSLDEVFMLTCNQRFLSSTAYDEVRDIIAVALAALYPLTDERIFEAVSAGMPPGEQLDWVRFKDNLERQLNQFLVQTAPQSGRTFFHACLREWLMGQSDAQMNSTQVQRGGTLLPSSHKYIVDFRRGHALLAAVVSNLPPERMDRKTTLELAHHVLKADMFRTRARKTGVSGSEHNALFMKKASTQMTEAFISARNLFYPSIKVNKLLLRAGANVNHPTTIFSKATPLAVVSHTGNVELSKLFLMFTANVDTPSTNGLSPLCYAAISGRQDVVELLLQYGPNLNQADMNGHTALLHAISRGHTNIAHILLHCNLYKEPQERSIATQRALVAAAMTGCIQLINYVLTSEVLYCDVNACDPVNGEAALTAAAFCGKTDACDVLVTKHRAQLNVRNRAGLTPLLKAVVHGEWATADLLLTLGAGLEETDPQGLTPLITAARQGHLGLLEVLLTRGAKITAADNEGLTALSWSALQGKAPCVKSLIAHGANVDRCDVHGRAPLGLAAFRGDLEIVDMLLRAGADIAHHDVSGMSPLDRAIGCEHTSVVASLLNHGASIRETSWAMANNKNEMMTQLLGKSLEDANAAYKSGDFRSACDQYARALGHVNEPATAATLATGHHRPTGKLADICAHLLLGYSRCQRKDGDLTCSEVSSTRALQLKPQWHEALYARARVLREKGKYKAALDDVNEAEQRAPKHNLKEIHRLGERIREEMRKNGAPVNVPHHQPSMSEPVALPARPRTNSSLAAYRRQDSNLSQSYQLNPLTSGDFPGQLQRQRSHESLNESMLSLNGSGYPEAPPRGGNQVRHPAVDRLVDHMDRFTAGGPVVPPRPTEPNRYMPARAVNRGVPKRPTTKSQFVTDL